MTRSSTGPGAGDGTEYESLVERTELVEDVRMAEAEIAAGQGLAHSKARTAVMTRLRP